MKKITLQATTYLPERVLYFEHSLVSLSAWEALYEKPFYGKDSKSPEETAAYIEMMLIDKDPPHDWFDRLTHDDIMSIVDHINEKQTATWFREDDKSAPQTETTTSELVYYWMLQFKIPFKPCDEWHFNHLMTLIKVAGHKQEKPKKMSKQAQAEHYRALNAQRREQLGTAG
mgnify:CR=1 FL=1